MSVSKLAQNLHGSEIIKIAGEINELKRQGQNIANLTIGDFDSNIYPIPAQLKEGIIDAYEHNQTNYPPADSWFDYARKHQLCLPLAGQGLDRYLNRNRR